MTKKAVKPVKNVTPHAWDQQGYACLGCGAISGTVEYRGECPMKKKQGFDIWLYHAGAGWWLDESELSQAAATTRLNLQLGSGNVVAGAVLPAGQRLGLFTKEAKSNG